MIFLMEHPEHGRMHVYDLGEKARVEQWGWKEVVETAEVTEPEPKRKPGRPKKVQ